MINDNNYMTIQGWMISKLKLKGVAKEAFAVIWGFTQDGNTKYQGSARYITKWTGCSMNTARKVLAELVELDYIIKNTINVNGVQFNEYAVNIEYINSLIKDTPYQKLVHPLPNSGTPPTKNEYTPLPNSGTSITNSNNKNNTISNSKGKTKRFVPPTQKEVEGYCKERNNNINAEKFIDFYESKGWMVGSNKMKDWKAAIRTWEKPNDKTKKNNRTIKPYWETGDGKPCLEM